VRQLIFESGILLLLLIANGLFAMAEIAVVSCKRSHLRQLADRGSGNARAALRLLEAPNRFLATVQVGITLVGIVAGAFGGATLAGKLEPWIRQVDFLAAHANAIAFVAVVSVITYCSLVIGELVPKRLGLSHPESIAMWVARPMQWVSAAAGPLVTFLDRSSDLLLRVVGFKPAGEKPVSEEEVRMLMQEGVRAGAFNKIESQIVHSALELDRLPVHDIMTPRSKIIWLNQDDPHEQVWHKIVVSGHSHFPVYAENRDRVVGVVSVKAVYANVGAGAGVQVRNLMVPPLVVPETQSVLQLVETFKYSGKHIAMVTDEFGGIVGLVTLNDVMEAVVGEFPTTDERARPSVVRRDDDSWLADALIEIDTLPGILPGFRLDEGERTEYATLAGFVLKQFGRVPREGETFTFQGYEFEVLDMDGHRVDKVLILPRPASSPGPAAGT